MAKILNFGSINIDYVYKIPRFLVAGETMASTDRQVFAGGKGLNQSIALARAGAAVWHAGRCGKEAAPFVALMRESGVLTDYVDTSAQQSGHAIIQVTDEGQNCIMLYRGANFEIDPAFVERVFRDFGAGDVLVLQNEINNLPLLVDTAHEKGMRIAFNPSPVTPDLRQLDLRKISWLLLNEVEGLELTGEREPAAMLDVFAARCPKTAIVLTLGKLGACYAGEKTRCSHGIYSVPVVDTTAAGDTFTGYFLQQVVAGKPAPEALHLASVASSLAVSRRGASASIPTMDEVLSSPLFALTAPAGLLG